MVLGVLSDIHGNFEALKVVLDLFAQKGVQMVLCTGDVVGYGPDPQQCIDAVQKIGAKTVAGNHEWGVLGRTNVDLFNPLARLAINWTKKQLSPAQANYLANLPLIYQFGPIHMVHSAPSDPASWDYLLSLEDVAGEMGAFTQDICIVGHTHIPMAVERISGGAVQLKSGEGFYLRDDAKYLLNAGSVGQPRDGDPKACCLIVNLTERSVSFYRVEYDIRTTQRKMRQVGLPEELAERLSRGR